MEDKAVDVYIVKRSEALRLLKAITDHIEDHMGTSPDNINWGHVGDAEHVVNRLSDIAAFLGVSEDQGSTS